MAFSSIPQGGIKATPQSLIAPPSLVEPDPYMYMGGDLLYTELFRRAVHTGTNQVAVFCVTIVMYHRNNHALSSNIARPLK